MILMYHDVSEESSFNAVLVSEFQKQMEYISNCGNYAILSLDEYVDNLKNPGYKNPITVTFDDGYVSLKTLILPIIKKYRIPIAIFVPVDHVGSHNAWDAEKGDPKIDILDWESVKELSREKLVTIGSHGLKHISHGDLDEASDLHEMKESKQVLEEQLGTEVKYYTFPFGQIINIGPHSIENVKRAGYKAALSTLWSRKNSEKDLYRLHRLEISGKDTMDSFTSKLESRIDTGFYKQKLKNVLFALRILK